ncbi:trypsin-3-like [Cylas formicarius]|uniref:trypsin-3-like n=1 Tax=Cylas formicarius TaxID=197179 RepID=UPI002958C580|nr:trypsin-3-like [Cylas formicarius]
MLNLIIILLFSVHSFVAPRNLNPGSRIIDGELVDISQVPYQVAILFEGKQVCGGSLISTTKVLTANHCWTDETNRNLSEYSVRVGSTDWEKGGQEIYASAVDLYDVPEGEVYLNYDIAVITLKSAVNVSNAIPIQLDDADRVYVDGEVVTISGWGLPFSPFEPIPPNVTIGKYPLSVINSTVVSCGDSSDSPDTILCIRQNGGGICYGDSGGPAVINGKLAGIVSSGICGSEKYPGAYTKISAFREWIRQHAGV